MAVINLPVTFDGVLIVNLGKYKEITEISIKKGVPEGPLLLVDLTQSEKNMLLLKYKYGQDNTTIGKRYNLTSGEIKRRVEDIVKKLKTAKTVPVEIEDGVLKVDLSGEIKEVMVKQYAGEITHYVLERAMKLLI